MIITKMTSTNNNNTNGTSGNQSGGQRQKRGPRRGGNNPGKAAIASMCEDLAQKAGTIDALRTQLKELKEEKDSDLYKMKQATTLLEAEVAYLDAEDKKWAAHSKSEPIPTFSNTTTNGGTGGTIPPYATPGSLWGAKNITTLDRPVLTASRVFVANVKAPLDLKVQLTIDFLVDQYLNTAITVFVYFLLFYLSFLYVPSFYGFFFEGLLSIFLFFFGGDGFLNYSSKKLLVRYVAQPTFTRYCYLLCPLLNSALIRISPFLPWTCVLTYLCVLWYITLTFKTIRLHLHSFGDGEYVPDCNPTFDADVVRRPAHTLRRYKPLVEVCYTSWFSGCDYYIYLDCPNMFKIQKRWLSDDNKSFKSIHLLEAMIPTLINRKTVVSSLYAQKQAVDRVCRLAENSSAFAEEYERLLSCGDSTLADTVLFGATLVAKDATIELQDF
jgi:hypothetical protein